MTHRRAARRIRIRRRRVAALLVVIAAVIAAALSYQSPASSSSTAAPPIDVPRRAPSEADGGLDPALLGALRAAETDAADDGVEIVVESGWRSPEHQAQLLREAVSKYGSAEEAARWGGVPRDVSSRVRRRGRHRAFQCHGVAVGARRGVRAVPDLRQRTVAFRAAPRSRRSGLPSDVPRPYARSKDAAVKLLVAFAVVVLIAGCSNTPAETGDTAGPATNRSKAAKFSDCMREHGVLGVPGTRTRRAS